MAQVRSPAWELPHASGVAKKQKTKHYLNMNSPHTVLQHGLQNTVNIRVSPESSEMRLITLTLQCCDIFDNTVFAIEIFSHSTYSVLSK